MKRNEGITLIALIITIIILIILSAITIGNVMNSDLFGLAKKATFLTGVREIQEQVIIKDVVNQKETKFGTLNGILGVDSSYNDKLVIENGKLAYEPDKFLANERKWLEEIGIYAKNNYYLVMEEKTKERFKGQTNIGTMEEFRDLVNTGNFNYDIAYMIEDISLNGNESNPWIPIGNIEENSFKGIFDGQNNAINDIYINADGGEQGLFGFNEGTIKNIGIRSGEIKGKAENIGAICSRNYSGTIEKCYNNIDISAEGSCIAGICAWNARNNKKML